MTERAGVASPASPGSWNQGATFVDINNDGRLDLDLCRFNAPNLLYINQGDGTFANVTDQAGLTGEALAHSATWWDFDGDGWPDLYVANDFGAPDKLYRNNRDGTFTDAIGTAFPHTAFTSMGADFGDINNDGVIDFLVADMAATTHFGDQRLTLRVKLRDPAPDSTTAPKYHRNALHLNSGTGRFLEAAELSGLAKTDWTWAVRFEDLDNDGRLDLHVSNGMVKEESLDLTARVYNTESETERARILRSAPVMAQANLAFRNLGDLKFANVSADWGLDERGVSFATAFADLDGTGNLDLVYTNYKAGLSAFRNGNTTGHRAIVELRGTASNRFGIGSTVTIESALGIQVRPLWLARGYMASSEPIVHFGLGADTIIRRLTVKWPSGREQSFENLPVDQRFTVAEPSAATAQSAEPRAADLAPFQENSHALGLAVSSREEPLGELNTAQLTPMRLTRLGPAIAIGDIFGDGRDAVAVGGTTLDPLQILRANSSGKFEPVATPGLRRGGGADDGPLLLFDAAGAGSLDLLVTKGGENLPADDPGYQPQLYLNDGRGNFSPAPEGTLPSLPISVGAAAAADWKHTGRLGLFVGGRCVPEGYPSAPRSALLENRGGRFVDVTDAIAPGLREVGLATSALWSDVDGDGWSDLLLTLEWGEVKYFHNEAGGGFADWSERAGFAAAGRGWWTSLAAADFNCDGRTDYVAGNVGLNTCYQADPAHPALLYAGDFRGNGSTQLIEAYYEGDKLYPRRAKSELGVAIPSILKRYPKNDLFARATLDQILGADKLQAATVFSATQFQSGVFLSQADGTFRFAPLPRLAQIAPLQGMVAGDFGDGRQNLYAVQNSYAPIPQVGRFDGGLSQLLRNDGRGNFAAVPPRESNLIVPGDANALALADLDGSGWPGFVVSRNHDTTLAFSNRGLPGRRPLRVVLRGPAGNPTAIGARVTVEFVDGSMETSEVHAGSGYYSQSSPAAYFSYAGNVTPKKIHVRWPSGLSSETAFAPGAPTLIIASP